MKKWSSQIALNSQHRRLFACSHQWFIIKPQLPDSGASHQMKAPAQGWTPWRMLAEATGRRGHEAKAARMPYSFGDFSMLSWILWPSVTKLTNLGQSRPTRLPMVATLGCKPTACTQKIHIHALCRSHCSPLEPFKWKPGQTMADPCTSNFHHNFHLNPSTWSQTCCAKPCLLLNSSRPRSVLKFSGREKGQNLRCQELNPLESSMIGADRLSAKSRFSKVLPQSCVIRGSCFSLVVWPGQSSKRKSSNMQQQKHQEELRIPLSLRNYIELKPNLDSANQCKSMCSSCKAEAPPTPPRTEATEESLDGATSGAKSFGMSNVNDEWHHDLFALQAGNRSIWLCLAVLKDVKPGASRTAQQGNAFLLLHYIVHHCIW